MHRFSVVTLLLAVKLAGGPPLEACPYFRKRFSKAWRASRGLEVEVSRSTVVRNE
jgi:hypothetical protein